MSTSPPSPARASAWLRALAGRLSRTRELTTTSRARMMDLLHAGHPMPDTLAGWLLVASHSPLLERCAARFPLAVPTPAQAAAAPLRRVDGEITTALHLLVDLHARDAWSTTPLPALLAAGARVDARDGKGLPALAYAQRIEHVQALADAGANPMEFVRGTSVLHTPLLMDRVSGLEDAATRRARWRALFDQHATPPHRPALAFALVAARRADLLEEMVSRWAWSTEDLQALTVPAVAARGQPPVQWTWPGWLAFHSISEVAGPERAALGQVLAGLPVDRVLQLPEWDRMWLAAADVHHHRQLRLGAPPSTTPSYPIPDAVSQSLARDTALVDWAMARQDLPVDCGAFAHYRALRHWLVGHLVPAWTQAQALHKPGLLGWTTRFLLEDLQGQERMDRQDYENLRGQVLGHACVHAPQAGDPVQPLVCMAAARALEQFLGPGRPSDSLKVGRLDAARSGELLGRWVQLPPNRLDWPATHKHVLARASQRLEGVHAPRPWAEPTPASWVGLAQALARQTRAWELEQALPAPAVRQRTRM